MRNKNGKLLSVYWFAILVLVSTGIVLMVNVFYSNPYDVREIEASVLSNRIADCIYYGGEINSGILNINGGFREDFQDKFSEECRLNFQTDDEFEPVSYYTQVEFFSDGNEKKVAFTLSAGNKNWKSDCDLNSKEKNLVKCDEKEFYLRTSSDAIYLVKILSIVGKTSENGN